MINLRPATPADLKLLQHWDQQPHVIAADPNDDWYWEVELSRNPDWREQLIAQIEGRPIGFVQIIDPLASNTRAHRFYERLGFQFVEPRRFGDDDCFVYCLNRADWHPENTIASR